MGISVVQCMDEKCTVHTYIKCVCVLVVAREHMRTVSYFCGERRGEQGG